MVRGTRAVIWLRMDSSQENVSCCSKVLSSLCKPMRLRKRKRQRLTTCAGADMQLTQRASASLPCDIYRNEQVIY